MKRIGSWLFVLVMSAAVAWLSTRSIWSSGSINNVYDWGFGLFDWRHTINEAWWSWSASTLGSATFIASNWLAALVMGVSGKLAGVSVDVYLKLWLTASVLFSTLGMVRLARSRKIVWPVAVIAGLLYGLAPTLFIRHIVGFVFWILAYTIAPWWLSVWWSISDKSGRRRSLLAALLFVIATAQQQYVVILLLIMLVDLMFADRAVRRVRLRALGWSVLLAALVHLPWLIMALRGGGSGLSSANANGSSLALISSLPHSLWRTMFNVDHHITFQLFDSLAGSSIFMAGSAVLLAVGLLAPITRRFEARVGVLLLAVAWIGGLGPVSPNQRVFSWLYETLPFTNLFRETYHWAALASLMTILLFAIGADWLVRRRLGWLFYLPLIISLGFVRPFALSDYYGYLKPQPVPEAYRDLTVSGQPTGNTLFLPSLGFLADKRQPLSGAANSDYLAISTNRQVVPYQSSTIDVSSGATGLRNALLARYYGLSFSADIGGYLSALGVNEVITRPNLESRFMRLFPPTTSPYLTKLWSRQDYDAMAQAQVALTLDQKTPDWSLYQVAPVSPIASLAKKSAVGAYDWSQLTLGYDAVFFQEDQSTVINDLPIIADKYDWVASTRQSDNHLGSLAVSAGSDPLLGWVRPAAAWWRQAGLAEAREGYLYTQSDQPLYGDINRLAGQYHLLAKLWHSPMAESITLSVGDFKQTISTQGAVSGFVWHDLGLVDLSALDSLVVVPSGEAALAQLLVVPENDWLSSQEAWAAVSVDKSNQTPPVGEVALTEINPTKYQLSYSSSREAWLIVRMTFDRDWRLKVAGRQYEPVKVNGYAMAFKVPGGSYDGTLYFAPQFTYRTAQYVSLAALIVTLYVLLGGRFNRRNKKPRSPIDLG